MNNIQLKMAELNKKFKADIIQQGTDIIEVDKIPFSSPNANFMTYGGIPVGKITEFFGGEGGGKTTSALDICGNAQRKFKAVYDDKVSKLEEFIAQETEKGTKDGAKKADKAQKELDQIIEQGAKIVAYVDTEQTLDVEWAEKIGVNTQELILVRPQEQTAEQVLQIMLELVATGNVGLIVLDSIPCLVPQQIYDQSLEKKAYGGISQPLTIFCSKILPYLVQNQCALIGINQIREDLSSMYNTISTPGGKAWKHACSLRLRFKKDTLLDMNNGELTSRAENPAGNRVAIEIVKTKVCKPDRRIGFYTLNYTNGIDVLYDAINVGVYFGIIEKAGAWYRLLDADGEIKNDKEGNPISYQGMPKFLDFFHNHKEEQEYLIGELGKLMYE